MSELLVARQGPLAHVWLASHYDKKLSKQQFLNTNIVTSSDLISHRQIEPISSQNSSNDTITLRLSGQLLLGIVRIYLRKTKYLLDDIHEVLHKLKTSFKYASGASLASSSAAASTSINLPPQRTSLASLARVTLPDQVATGIDLLYQEDLILDETSDNIMNAMAQFQPATVASQGAEDNNNDDIDRSVEFARRASDAAAGTDADIMDADIDLDMDFDLDMDRSVEVGRDAQAALPDSEQSFLDINVKDPAQNGLPDVTFDLDLPEGNEGGASNDSDGPHEAQTPPQGSSAQVRSMEGTSETGVVRTAKRRMVIDAPEDLERGIPNEVLRNIQAVQTQGRFSSETLSLRLSPQEKLDLIDELAVPTQLKRRKIWNLDQQLRQRCLELSQEEEHSFNSDSLADQSQDLDFDLDMDTNIDFDLSLPGLDSDNVIDPLQTQREHEDDAEQEDVGPENIRSTTQVAEHLRSVFYDKPAVTLDEIMAMDTAAGQQTPLGLTHKTTSGVKVNDRREATKCFFELLVLATHDCVSLEQEAPANGTQIQDNVRVRPRDALVSRFL